MLPKGKDNVVCKGVPLPGDSPPLTVRSLAFSQLAIDNCCYLPGREKSKEPTNLTGKWVNAVMGQFTRQIQLIFYGDCQNMA